jgi:ABC-type polar amino acid transport system ATPase subunit
MKHGHYEVDVNNISKQSKCKFMGMAIMSHEHKHARNCGKEVWHWSAKSGWQHHIRFGEFITKPKPKIIELMELTGAL